MTDLTATVPRPTDAPPRPCPRCGRMSPGIEWTDASGVLHRLYLCPVEHSSWEERSPAECRHEWVSVELDMGDGRAVEQCLRCGTLTLTLTNDFHNDSPADET